LVSGDKSDAIILSSFNPPSSSKSFLSFTLENNSASYPPAK
jgi:hypothetical protein